MVIISGTSNRSESFTSLFAFSLSSGKMIFILVTLWFSRLLIASLKNFSETSNQPNFKGNSAVFAHKIEANSISPCSTYALLDLILS